MNFISMTVPERLKKLNCLKAGVFRILLFSFRVGGVAFEQQFCGAIYYSGFTNYNLQLDMAIKTAGIKSAKTSEIKIENQTEIDLPKGTDEMIRKIFAFLPIEHLRGIEKIRLVDYINDPRLKNANVQMKGDLPGLYHPKVQGAKAAWLEVSIGALLKPFGKFTERWMAKSSFKANLAGLIFSLVGQHYYLTMRHSVKKQNLEPQIRQYAEKNLRSWSAKQSEGSFRAKLFKPIRPYMEKWAKWLNKKAAAAQKKT